MQVRLLIGPEVRSLVAQLDHTHHLNHSKKDALLLELFAHLEQACAQESQSAGVPELGLCHYPLDAEGYARAYDPLAEESEFRAVWARYGMVVGKAILSAEQCADTQKRIDELLRSLASGRQLDAAGVPALSRGFFEIYHDRSLADIRQGVRFYLHHVLIWQQARLWCSFDRFGVKPPGHPDSSGLPLHVDQNPNMQPDFQTVQGVLALTDCPAERGTFLAVPGSRGVFAKYAALAKNNGEYIELDLEQGWAAKLARAAQPIPLRAGDLVSWDSRTTHANTANISQDARYVAYVAAGPAREQDPSAVAARMEAFRTGLGSNVRGALMHASRKPRYTAPEVVAALRQPEQLNLLGRCLYGQESYPSAAQCRAVRLRANGSDCRDHAASAGAL